MANNNDFDKAKDKFLALEQFAEKGILKVDLENNIVTIHYLLWHTFSEEGQKKLKSSCLYYLNMKKAMEELPVTNLCQIWVDYTDEPNDYNLNGIKVIGAYEEKNTYTEV